MLIAVTVMPIVFDMLTEVPEGSPAQGAALSALATIVAIVAIGLKATGTLRLWAPVIGIVAGTVVASFFGLYNTAQVAEAAWIGIPSIAWPGFDLSFGPTFWALLPAFVFVTLVGAIETIGDSVAIQRVSWRRDRAVDFRTVQGAVAADGVGNLLSGLAGTVPNTTYSSSVSVTELTGVAARSVGVAAGAVFLVMAFLPKVLALILAIPGPVAAAYITVLISMLFVVGMRIVIQDGIDHRNALIAGVSFWIGAGLQSGVIFPEYFSAFAGGLLQNGMTGGGLIAILLTLFVELTEPRRRRIEVEFDTSALPTIREFSRQIRFRRRLGRGHGAPSRRRQRGDAADVAQPGSIRRRVSKATASRGCSQARGRSDTGLRCRTGHGQPGGPDRAAGRTGRDYVDRAGKCHCGC